MEDVVLDQSPCEERCDGWGFDANIEVDIISGYHWSNQGPPYFQDLTFSSDTPPDTLAQHERRHTRDMSNGIDAINLGLWTEFFATRQECERARSNFKFNLRNYLNNIAGGTGNRWDRHAP
jgi:hypothetical protein